MKSKFEEFNDHLNDLYSCRDEYSRGYIIDAVRDKYKQLHVVKNEKLLAKDEKCEGCKYEYIASWEEPCKYCIELSKKE